MRLIDDNDRAMLRMLRRDSRVSITELSQTLGLARGTVQSRLDRLRRDGIIRRFTIETDSRVETDPIAAISMISVTAAKMPAVQSSLTRMQGIERLWTTNGSWDLIAETQSKDLAEFDQVLNTMLKVQGISKIETCLLLTRIV